MANFRDSFFFKNEVPRDVQEKIRVSRDLPRVLLWPLITFGEFAGQRGSLMKRPNTAKNCATVCGNSRPKAPSAPKDDPAGADHRDPGPYDQLGKLASEHERYYALSMDAMVFVCSWNTNVLMGWTWMLW